MVTTFQKGFHMEEFWKGIPRMLVCTKESFNIKSHHITTVEENEMTMHLRIDWIRVNWLFHNKRIPD